MVRLKNCSSHAKSVEDLATAVLTHSQCPVHTQVQRNHDEVVEKEVDSLGPALHRSMSLHLGSTSTTQLGEEEGAERVNLRSCCLTGTSLHDQGEVEVYHLWWWQQKHDEKRNKQKKTVLTAV